MAATYLHICTVLDFICLGMESFVLLLLTKNIKDRPKRLKKKTLCHKPDFVKRYISIHHAYEAICKDVGVARLYLESLAAEEIRGDGTVLTGSPCAYVPGLSLVQ